MRVDSCHAAGALFVPGAPDDLRRPVRFIHRFAGAITGITCSLDSLLPLQFFHPAWWTDGAGCNPPPFGRIGRDEVADERWRPLHEPAWSVEYTRRLRERDRGDMTISPITAASAARVTSSTRRFSRRSSGIRWHGRASRAGG